MFVLTYRVEIFKKYFYSSAFTEINAKWASISQIGDAVVSYKVTLLDSNNNPITGYVDKPATGTTYNFAEDGKSCTATRVCLTDSTHVETETANGEYELFREAKAKQAKNNQKKTY